jgi:outer membrane protein assembly factor BamB
MPSGSLPASLCPGALIVPIWRLLGAFLGAFLGAASASADDWPQWRGPASLGVSAELDLPVHWGVNLEDAPDGRATRADAARNIAWTVGLAGTGASSPIVWGGRVFVTSQVGKAPSAGGDAHPLLARDEPELARSERPIAAIAQRNATSNPSSQSADDVWLVVEAFDLEDGRRLWQHREPARGPFPELHEKHNLATPTPTTDGERVYAWFGNGQLLTLDLGGKPLWSRHLGEEHGTFQNRWGHGSSPALHGDHLILLCDHLPASYLLALDRRTGEQRWKVDRGAGRVAHSTPVVIPTPTGPELLVNSSTRIDAFDPRTGELLWHLGTERQTPVPSAVYGDGLVFLSRGYRNSDVLALRGGGRGEVSQSHVVWRVPSGASYVPSVLLYRSLVFLSNEIGVVTAVDAASGERVWRERLGGVFFASPVGGDGKVYLLSESGETFVLEIPENSGAGNPPRLLARNVLGEDLDDRFLASPAIAGGRVLLRGDGTLYAIGR